MGGQTAAGIDSHTSLSGIDSHERVQEADQENLMKRKSPGRYLRLDLFIKVLSLLCPNLTDA